MYIMCIMAIGVVKFSRKWYKIRKVFGQKINCSHMKSLNFANWCNGEVSKSAKSWIPKSIFYFKNHSNISDFFSWKKTNLGAHFLLLTFFDNINFQITLFSKIMLNFLISFDYSGFLAKNLSNIVSLPWNLHNRYCVYF